MLKLDTKKNMTALDSDKRGVSCYTRKQK